MIIVLGSINADIIVRAVCLPAPGETVLGRSYEMAAGGKGLNQAVAAARLQAPGGDAVQMIGAVGEDAFADLPLKALSNSGVDTRNVQRVTTPTGCAFITVDGSGENQITVAQGANLCVTSASVPDALLTTATTAVCQLEVPVPEVASLLARVRAAGGRTILNIAPYAPLDRATLACVDVLVANRGEADAIAREHGVLAGDPEPLVRRLAGLGCGAVVVTLGPGGAVAWAGGKFLKCPAPEIRPVDTTGAGDTFVGALAAMLDGGSPFETALKFAVAAGALACLTPGAAPSIPDRASVIAVVGE